MSQYTISLKSLIDIYAHFNDNDSTFCNTEKRVLLGRQIFFNFDYNANATFKMLFERGFIINNLLEDICYNDAEYWRIKLENDVKIMLPAYSKRWEAVQALRVDAIAELSKTKSNSKTNNEAENKTSAKSKNKTLGSTFPNDIHEAKQFDDVHYMDNGTMGDSDSTGTSTGTSETINETNTAVTGNILDKIEIFDRMQKDIITEAIDAFNYMFIGLW